jgi:hypothetical protein
MFCPINIQNIFKLVVNKKKTIKEVAYHYILFKIHNVLVGHSGENKTENQIDSSYSLFPEGAISEYIKKCPV